MNLTIEEAHDLALIATGAAIPLVLTGVAAWFVVIRNGIREGTVIRGEEIERAKKRNEP